MTLTRPGKKLDVPLFYALNANRIRPNDGTPFFSEKGVPLGGHQYSSRRVCVCGFLFPIAKKEQVFFICVPSISLPTPHSLSRSFCNGLYVPIDPV